jgi:hypothetical protein
VEDLGAQPKTLILKLGDLSTILYSEFKEIYMETIYRKLNNFWLALKKKIPRNWGWLLIKLLIRIGVFIYKILSFDWDV